MAINLLKILLLSLLGTSVSWVGVGASQPTTFDFIFKDPSSLPTPSTLLASTPSLQTTRPMLQTQSQPKTVAVKQTRTQATPTTISATPLRLILDPQMQQLVMPPLDTLFPLTSMMPLSVETQQEALVQAVIDTQGSQLAYLDENEMRRTRGSSGLGASIATGIADAAGTLAAKTSTAGIGGSGFVAGATVTVGTLAATLSAPALFVITGTGALVAATFSTAKKVLGKKGGSSGGSSAAKASSGGGGSGSVASSAAKTTEPAATGNIDDLWAQGVSKVADGAGSFTTKLGKLKPGKEVTAKDARKLGEAAARKKLSQELNNDPLFKKYVAGNPIDPQTSGSTESLLSLVKLYDSRVAYRKALEARPTNGIPALDDLRQRLVREFDNAPQAVYIQGTANDEVTSIFNAAETFIRQVDVESHLEYGVASGVFSRAQDAAKGKLAGMRPSQIKLLQTDTNAVKAALERQVAQQKSGAATKIQRWYRKKRPTNERLFNRALAHKIDVQKTEDRLQIVRLDLERINAQSATGEQKAFWEQLKDKTEKRKKQLEGRLVRQKTQFNKAKAEVEGVEDIFSQVNLNSLDEPLAEYRSQPFVMSPFKSKEASDIPTLQKRQELFKKVDKRGIELKKKAKKLFRTSTRD